MFCQKCYAREAPNNSRHCHDEKATLGFLIANCTLSSFYDVFWLQEDHCLQNFELLVCTFLMHSPPNAGFLILTISADVNKKDYLRTRECLTLLLARELLFLG